MINPISKRYLFARALATFVVFTSEAIGATIHDLPPAATQPSIVGAGGVQIPLYKGSYALLVSESKYLGAAKNGWRPLDNTPAELDQVATALQKQGFAVRRVTDATSVELVTILKDFTAHYGHDKDNRLVVFFSGHGFTDKDSGMGYVVPIDALNPVLNRDGFYSKAIPIQDFDTIAKSVSARHVLFLFDSCFSGSIFMLKGNEGAPEVYGKPTSFRQQYFLQAGQKPVRQFIAAGGPDQEVPADSSFTALFIAALEGGASSSNDGYVTGKEIGAYIEQRLPHFNPGQSPHSDVLRDPRFTFGDMVFQPFGGGVAVSQTQQQAVTSASATTSSVDRDDQNESKPNKSATDTAASQRLSPPIKTAAVESTSFHWGRSPNETVGDVGFGNNILGVEQAVRDICEDSIFSDDGRIVASPTADGLGYFDVRTGKLLNKIRFDRVVNRCPKDTWSFFFSNGSKSLVQSWSDKESNYIYQILSLDTFQTSTITVPKEEELKSVYPNNESDSIIVGSTRYWKSGPRKGSIDYIIRKIRSDGSIIAEHVIRDNRNNNSIRLKIEKSIERLTQFEEPRYYQGYVFTKESIVDADLLVDKGTFREYKYRDIGCGEENAYLFVRGVAQSLIAVSGYGIYSGLGVCLIEKTGAGFIGKKINIAIPSALTGSGSGTPRVLKTINDDVVVFAGRAYKPEEAVFVWAQNIDKNAASDMRKLKILGISAPTGDMGTTYFTNPDKTVGLYIVKFDTPLF